MFSMLVAVYTIISLTNIYKILLSSSEWALEIKSEHEGQQKQRPCVRKVLGCF